MLIHKVKIEGLKKYNGELENHWKTKELHWNKQETSLSTMFDWIRT